jgi:hypothetical protein
LVRSRDDLQQIRSALENLDVFEWARQQRPNSKWVVADITNATFYVTKLRDHPIGRSTRLPKYVTLEELPVLEKLFKLNIYVYRLEECEDEDSEKTKIVAQLIQRSHRTFSNSIYLNL